MSRAPDITLPDDIRSEPNDPRVDSFHNDPVLVVMQWTDELKGPMSTGDEDLVGYTPDAVETHNRLYKAWLDTLLGHISCGRYVAVRGWRPNATISWDVSSVSKFKGSTNQQIQYQGKTYLSKQSALVCSQSLLQMPSCAPNLIIKIKGQCIYSPLYVSL
jgi:hypothetical protein